MEERTDSGELSAPSVRATGVIIETQRLRMRAHRDDDLAHLVVLAGNWESRAGPLRSRTLTAKPMGGIGSLACGRITRAAGRTGSQSR